MSLKASSQNPKLLPSAGEAADETFTTQNSTPAANGGVRGPLGFASPPVPYGPEPVGAPGRGPSGFRARSKWERTQEEPAPPPPSCSAASENVFEIFHVPMAAA